MGYKVVPAPVELSTRAWGAYSLSTAAVFASYLQLREHRTIFLFGSYWWFSFVCFLFHRWIQGFVLEPLPGLSSLWATENIGACS